MVRTYLLLVVVALCWAAAAPDSFADGVNYYANPQNVETNYGGEQVTVTVDGSYACEHPEQVGLQADAVVTRQRVGNLEVENDQQWNAINSQPKVVVVGVPTQTVVPQPTYVPAPVPYGTAGGPATNQPVVPATGGRTMNPLAYIAGIIGVVVGALIVLGFAAPGVFGAFGSTINSLLNTRETQRIERQNAQTEADRTSMGLLMDALPDVVTASPDGDGERYSWTARTRNGSVRRSGRLRSGGAAVAAPGTPAAPAVAVSDMVRNAARASLLRPTAAGLPAGGAAAPVAYSDTKRDALASAIAGLPVIGDAQVDSVRDMLITAGVITR